MELKLLREARGESTTKFVTVPIAHAMSTCVTHFCYLPGPCRHLKLLPLIKFKDFIGGPEKQGPVSEPARDLTKANIRI